MAGEKQPLAGILFYTPGITLNILKFQENITTQRVPLQRIQRTKCRFLNN